MGNKYEFWLSPEGLDRLRQWSGQGLNDAQIAREAGVRPDTLRAWKKKFPRLAQGVDQVHVPADLSAQIFWLKNRMPDKWQEKPDAGKLSLLRLDEALGELKNGIEQETE